MFSESVGNGVARCLLFVPDTLPFLIRLKVLPALPFEVFRIFRVIYQRSIRWLRWASSPEKIFQIDPAPRSLRRRRQTRATPEDCDGNKYRPAECACSVLRPLCFVTMCQEKFLYGCRDVLWPCWPVSRQTLLTVLLPIKATTPRESKTPVASRSLHR